jgi:hypothetical protein
MVLIFLATDDILLDKLPPLSPKFGQTSYHLAIIVELHSLLGQSKR